MRTWRPLTYLKPRESYRITLDLAAMEYALLGVVRSRVQSLLRAEIEQWLRDGIQEVNLTIVLLHDPAGFEQSDTPVQALRVNLEKLRAFSSVREPITAPFEIMRENHDPPFVFGRTEFQVRTRSTVGTSTLSFSVWVNGRPVEEFSAPFCIAPDENVAGQCPATPAVAYTLKGVDSLRLAAKEGSTPDAALHFVEIQGRLHGVLWRRLNATEGFLTWQLEERSGVKLEQYLARAVMPAFAAATNEVALRAVGRGLYNLLFPPDASAARQAFEAFVGAYPRLTAATPAGAVAPSIYVRVVASSLSSELMVPIGLMWVNDAFVGFSFRVELPLPVQSYGVASACVSRWIMALPPKNSDRALADALAVFTDKIEGAQGWQERGAAVHRDMADVRAWLADGKTDREPSAFFITSHHHQDRIYFREGEAIFSAEIEHRFARPSIAVLNGCGTGGPGAIDFVRELNKGGVSAVVATSTEVTGDMAGRFLVCLTNAVDAATATTNIPLSNAYLAALHCLRTQAPQGGTAYGGRALAYLLLGDGNLWLCPPRRMP